MFCDAVQLGDSTTKILDLIEYVFLVGIFYPWTQMDFVYRWSIAMLVIAPPVGFVHQVFQYRRLLAEIKKGIPHVAPILVRGGISGEFGAHQAGFALRVHLSEIAKTFRKARSAKGTLHGEAIALVSKSLEFYPSEHLVDLRVEEQLHLKIGNTEIPIGLIVNFLLSFFNFIPVPYRSRYLAAQIHVSLVSLVPKKDNGQSETHLVVLRHGSGVPESAKPKPNMSVPTAENETALAETRTVGNFGELSDILRDAAFMTLQLTHGHALPGRNWVGMKYFSDGLDFLDQLARTGNPDYFDDAIANFLSSSEADLENYEALYIRGSLLYVKRDRGSIETAIKLFVQALKTDQRDFHAIVHAGIASCHAQLIHRWAVRDEYVLRMADEHAKKAETEWEEARPGSPNAWILGTRALVGIVGEKIRRDKEESRLQFLESAKLFEAATKIEPNNASHYNSLGWVHMRLLEWDIEVPGASEEILPVTMPETARKAEHNLLESLKRDPMNKLAHANLCLLYANKWFVNKNRTMYLDRCLSHGKKATAVDSDYINGYRDLAFSLIRYGNLDLAHKEFKKALARSSGDEEKRIELIKDARKAIGDGETALTKSEKWYKTLYPPALGSGEQHDQA